MAEKKDTYEFGPFRVDAGNHQLLRDGVVVPLKPKAFDTLLLLIEHRGRIVPKEELMRLLWPDSVVEEASLTQNIYEVRKALAGADHGYVENVPRRGYRFVGNLATMDASGGRSSIAVLPFRALGGSTGNEHLEIGLADALITVLTNLKRLIVRPLSAVGRYATTPHDAITAARELHVELVVEGSVQTAGDRIRVTARLVDGTSGAALWGGAFDEKLADIFSVQDAIARKVAAAIGPELSEREQHLTSRHSTENREAYQLYLKGRYNWIKATPEGLWRAIDFFRAAIAIDPRYALAYVGLSDAYTSLDWYGVLSTRESNPHALAAAKSALEIDDGLAEGHASMAMARQYAWEWTAAEREYRKAIVLNPFYAPAWQWYGVFLAFMGRFSEALIHVRRAQELDPVSLSIGSQVALVFIFARRYVEAEDELRQVLEVDSGSIEALFMLAITLDLQGRYVEAIDIYEALPADNPDFRAMLAHACSAAGDVERGRAIIADLVTAEGDRHVAHFWLAVAYLGVGETAQALLCLERACSDPDDSLLAVNVFEMLDSLRSNPRFREVLRRMHLEPPA